MPERRGNNLPSEAFIIHVWRMEADVDFSVFMAKSQPGEDTMERSTKRNFKETYAY